MPTAANATLFSVFSENLVAVVVGLAGIAAYYLFTRADSERKQHHLLKFIKLHSEDHHEKLVKQASDLLMEQWPHKFMDAGLEEHNFVSIDSLSSSSDSLPCHLLAVKCLPGHKISEGEVVGHVVLRKGPRSGAQGKERFAKMLKVGVPIDTVRKAAQVMGVDISNLLEKYESGEQFSLDDFSLERKEKEREVAVAALLVAKPHRREGIGKALCAYAVMVAGEMNAGSVIGNCSTECVPFFFHIGCHKATGSERVDIPKVKLGNEMVTKITPDILSRALGILENKKYVD